MFKVEVYYNAQYKLILTKKNIFIDYGFIQVDQTFKKLGQQQCQYKDQSWFSTISFDNAIFNNIESLWVQFNNRLTNINLTDKLLIDNKIINRQIRPFDSKVELSSNVYLLRVSEPYCDLYNIFPPQYQTSLEILNKIKQGHKHIVMIAEMQL